MPVAPCKFDPLTPQQRRSIGAAVRRIDVPPKVLKNLVREVSGQEEAGKLSKSQAGELLTLLAARDSAGRPIHQGGVPLLVEYAHSPSVVLSQSGAGTQIYTEAEKQFFEQQRLTDRFTRNYQKVTRDLSQVEKDQIAQYRLRVDENGQPTEHDADFLPPKLQEVNERLTALVFEPMWRIGVDRGLVDAERHIDDYLTYYRDDHYRMRKNERKDMAQQIAGEMGVPLAIAEKILDEANVKKVAFGPFDYRRLGSIPGLRNMDRIAEIYIKGFARKVAVSEFLKVANALRPRIVDEGLRRYAKAYIDQYAGRPRYTFLEDWFQQTKAAIPVLRNIPLSAGQVAGTLTAVQYAAKIGGNLFTPILNLTQTLNTAVEAGALRTFGVLPRAAAVILLPERLNPFVRDLARLHKSGILDSLTVKFERPRLVGVKGRALDALTFLFDKSEQFNRATAFLAGYESAKAAGATESKALVAGRETVRVTQFFAGRLDSPLFARTPTGRVVMQFKTYTVKEIEFIRHLSFKEKVKFAAWSTALGGPAALGILQAFRAFFPDWDLTRLLEEWQESWNIAGFLQADHLANQLGIFQVPGLEDLGGREFKNRLLGWAAGPTLNAIMDIVQQGAVALKDRDKTEQFVAAVVRGTVPSGVEILRVKRAMEQARDPQEALRILLNFHEQKRGSSSGELRRLLGTDADLVGEAAAGERRLLSGSTR